MREKILHITNILAIIIASFCTHQYLKLKINFYQLEENIKKQEKEIISLGSAYTWFRIEHKLTSPFDDQLDSLNNTNN